MHQIKKILVTTDFSETSQTAFSLAREVAERFDARLVVLHVIDAQLPPLVFEPSGVSAGEFELERAERSTARLKDFAAQLDAGAEPIVTAGTPHLEIVKFAENNEIDLIVIATHGRGFFSHAILGSTTERVVRRAPCQVLTVRDTSLDE